MPIYYPSWVDETLLLDRVLELKAFNPQNGDPMHFRIEVFLAEATDGYVARCFQRQPLNSKSLWEMFGESSGHGNVDEAVQQIVNRIDAQLQPGGAT